MVGSGVGVAGPLVGSPAGVVGVDGSLVGAGVDGLLVGVDGSLVGVGVDGPLVGPLGATKEY